jgi:DNA-binding XRE family transcriptional regulator
MSVTELEKREATETRLALHDPIVLAVSVVFDRLGSLPKPDRDALAELMVEWPRTDSAEERESIRRAVVEILAQGPPSVRELPLPREEPLSGGLRTWAQQVGGRIKQLREQSGLTQIQLAEKAGLTQSHISRLEHADHSPTNLTLQKIAGALGVDVGQIDPHAA